ncbi:MAG: hypothetical protein EZS28_033767, partial [Streblomastix strix]
NQLEPIIQTVNSIIIARNQVATSQLSQMQYAPPNSNLQLTSGSMTGQLVFEKGSYEPIVVFQNPLHMKQHTIQPYQPQQPISTDISKQ